MGTPQHKGRDPWGRRRKRRRRRQRLELGGTPTGGGREVVSEGLGWGVVSEGGLLGGGEAVGPGVGLEAPPLSQGRQKEEGGFLRAGKP